MIIDSDWLFVSNLSDVSSVFGRLALCSELDGKKSENKVEDDYIRREK